MRRVICVNAAPTFGGVQKCFSLPEEQYAKLGLEDFPIQGTRFCYKFEQKNTDLVIYWNEQNNDKEVFRDGASVQADAIFEFWRLCDNDSRVVLQRLLLPALVDTTTQLYISMSHKRQNTSASVDLEDVCRLLQDIPCPLVYAVYSFRLMKHQKMSEWKYAVPPLDDKREWVSAHREMARHIFTKFWPDVLTHLATKSHMEFCAWAWLPCLEKPSFTETQDQASREAVKEIAKARLAASTNLSAMVRSAYLKVLRLTEDDVREEPWFPLDSLPFSAPSSGTDAAVLNDKWTPGLTRQDFCRWEAADAFHTLGMMALSEGGDQPNAISAQFCIQRGMRRPGSDTQKDNRCLAYVEETRIPEVLRNSSFFGKIRKDLTFGKSHGSGLSALHVHLAFFLRIYEDEKDPMMSCLCEWLKDELDQTANITARTIEDLADKLVREAFYAHEELLLKVKSATHYVRCSLAAALAAVYGSSEKGVSRFKILARLKEGREEPVRKGEFECVKDLS